LNTQVLGISTDPVPSVKAWAESLNGIQYPLLSDFWPHGAVSQRYGVLRPQGYSERALFVLDRHGIIRYIDIHDIDSQPDNELLFNTIRTIDPGAATREPLEEKLVGNIALPNKGLVIYCTTWCPACKRARRWLEERKIRFTEVEIYSTPGAKDQLKKWTGGNLTTPTFSLNGDVLINFDEMKLAEMLRKHAIHV
jgi:glutaredoxin